MRHRDLRPCVTAFLDTRTPGSDQKENFTIIGPGVSESPDQHVHIEIPHGFNLGGARQPPGCVNSQHSHETAEVFIVQSGNWAFYTGESADEGEVWLSSGDTISIPTRVFRGFKNVGQDTGFLFAVLGEDDPGRVTWAPSVFAAASDHGLVLLENGRLVDKHKGEELLPGDLPMAATTPEQVASMQRLDCKALEKCVARHEHIGHASSGAIREYHIIGEGASSNGFVRAQLDWAHGFSLRHVRMQPAASTLVHQREEEQVVLVHRGEIGVEVPDGEVRLGRSDVVTIPVGLPRRLFNPSAEPSEVFMVYRGDRVPALEPMPDE